MPEKHSEWEPGKDSVLEKEKEQLLLKEQKVEQYRNALYSQNQVLASVPGEDVVEKVKCCYYRYCDSRCWG